MERCNLKVNDVLPGEGVLHQIFSSHGQHGIKDLTQSDLRFCKNEESNRSKINEKRGSIGSKIKEKVKNKMLKNC